MEHPEGVGFGRDGPSRERRPHPPYRERHRQRRRATARRHQPRQRSSPHGRDPARGSAETGAQAAVEVERGRTVVRGASSCFLDYWRRPLSERLDCRTKPITDDPACTLQMRSPADFGTHIGNIDPHERGRDVLPCLPSGIGIEQSRVQSEMAAIVVGHWTSRRYVLKHKKLQVWCLLINLAILRHG